MFDGTERYRRCRHSRFKCTSGKVSVQARDFLQVEAATTIYGDQNWQRTQIRTRCYGVRMQKLLLDHLTEGTISKVEPRYGSQVRHPSSHQHLTPSVTRVARAQGGDASPPEREW